MFWRGLLSNVQFDIRRQLNVIREFSREINKIPPPRWSSTRSFNFQREIEREKKYCQFEKVTESSKSKERGNFFLDQEAAVKKISMQGGWKITGVASRMNERQACDGGARVNVLNDGQNA